MEIQYPGMEEINVLGGVLSCDPCGLFKWMGKEGAGG